MTPESFARAVASTRSVLVQVQPDQLDLPTPCASWDVRALINHTVDATRFFAAGVAGEPPAEDEVDHAAGDFVAAFDEAGAAAVAAFSADGALDRTLDLPFGPTPARGFLGIATGDCFTHGWDLARAIGVDADLDPELAAELLDTVKAMMAPSFRGADGSAAFGPELDAPEGATAADRLAAFLGRTV